MIQNGLLPVPRKPLIERLTPASRSPVAVNVRRPFKIAQVIVGRGRLRGPPTRLDRMADPIDLRAPEPDLDEEIARRDEEILRLRDLLIARDAELGQVRGRLKVIEDHSERMARIAAKIPLPGAAWIIDALLKLMSARRG